MNDDRMTPEALAEIEGKSKKCASNKLPALALIFSTERELALDAVPQMVAEIQRVWDENEKTMGELRRARKFGDDLAHLMSAAIRQREKAKDELRKQISHTIRARRLRDALTVENKRLRALLHKIYNVADEERFLEVTAVIDAENGGSHE